MFQVRDVFEDARKIFRHCTEDLIFQRLGDAIELLTIKGEFDPLLGYVDICIVDQCITLPREIEQVLAINLDGKPVIGKNPFHTFHLNGPGDFLNDRFSWTDIGQFPTYRDLPCPGKLISFVDKEVDQGIELRVFGFDDQNRPLRTLINGVWEDGHIVPTIFGYAVPASSDPVVSRITSIVKERSAGDIRLSSLDNSSTSGTLIGIFEPDETIPEYRRIRLGYRAKWARVTYRKRTYRVTSMNDRILLHNRLALILAMRAVQFWHDTDMENATAYEAHAVRILTEKEMSIEGPMSTPIQVQDRNSIKNPGYDDIS